jgi:glutamine synthetase
VAWTKAEKRMMEVRAADPTANPLPMAAVVLPTASRESVISRTSASWRS